MINTVLLCPPEFYQIEYEINPWMNINKRVNPAIAKEEFDQLVQIYRDLGLKVELLKAQPGLPDMVYAANHGFVIDDLFIKASFRYPQRRKEADHAHKHFHKKGHRIAEVDSGAFFEGQGDLFYRDGKFFFGHGKRSSYEAVAELEKILREDLISFEVNDPYYYHLDTCFAPLGKGIAVVNPASFSRADLEKIKKNFIKVIETDVKDNSVMCCNPVSVNG